MLVTVNNRLKFEIEIVHDLSCHPIFIATDEYIVVVTMMECSVSLTNLVLTHSYNIKAK